MAGYEERLRRLSINDVGYLDAILGAGSGDCSWADLDPRSTALVRLGVLIALDGPATSFDVAVSAAQAAGATTDEIVDVLVVAAPLVGSAHVVSSAPRVAHALGYDVDSALEAVDPDTAVARRDGAHPSSPSDDAAGIARVAHFTTSAIPATPDRR